MMRDDGGISRKWFAQAISEPRTRELVPPDRVCGVQLPIRRCRANESKVAHRTLRIPHATHGRDVIVVQLEVRPERTSEKANVAQNEHVVLQKMNVGLPCEVTKLIQRVVEVPSIEFVIPGDEDNWLGRIVNECPSPLNASVFRMDVASQHNDIGAGNSLRISCEWLEFIVKIGYDEQFHGSAIEGLVTDVTDTGHFLGSTRYGYVFVCYS
jgi:hypothetical protein